MARGVWRRSGEAFSAYCGRQITAHQEEIERCDLLAKQRAQDGYFGAMHFYSHKAMIERASCMKWRREMRAALITEGQADKNSDDPHARREARAKLQTANSSYGKFSTERIQGKHSHTIVMDDPFEPIGKFKGVDGRRYEIHSFGPVQPIENYRSNFSAYYDLLKAEIKRKP